VERKQPPKGTRTLREAASVPRHDPGRKSKVFSSFGSLLPNLGRVLSVSKIFGQEDASPTRPGGSFSASDQGVAFSRTFPRVRLNGFLFSADGTACFRAATPSGADTDLLPPPRPKQWFLSLSKDPLPLSPLRDRHSFCRVTLSLLRQDSFPPLLRPLNRGVQEEEFFTWSFLVGSPLKAGE